MTSSSTPTKAPKKAPAKKPAKKAAGSSRVAALASKLATSPGSVTATASLPSTSGDAAAAAASLLGLSPVAASPAMPSVADESAISPMDPPEPPPAVVQVEADAAGAVHDSSVAPADGVSEAATGEEPAEQPNGTPEAVAVRAPQPLALVPDPDAGSGEAADGTSATDGGSAAPAETAEPDTQAAAARRPRAKSAASKSPKKAGPADIEGEQAERLDELVWTLSSPEHSLDQQHDRISKLTLELPIPLVDVLNRWELDQVRRTGRRLYRERLIDLALAQLPSDMDKVVAMARDLPAWLKYAETEQVGSRVRAPVALELKVMKQELKLRREKGTYVRHIYAVALLDFLTSYGVPVEEPAS